MLFWSQCFQHSYSITLTISQSSGLPDSLVNLKSRCLHPFLPPGVFAILGYAILPQISTALLQDCRAVREESCTWVSWRHEKFISWALLAPGLYFLFHLFLACSLLYSPPPVFPSPPNLSLLSLHSWQMTYQLTAFGISFLVLSFKDSEVHAS